MKRLLLALSALAALLVPALAWGAPPVSPPAGSRAGPTGSTIVDVSGDRDDGYRVEHYDGSVDFTPTASEARAECGEYHRRVARVRCRTAVRVWYRDLGRLEQALDYAHRGS